MSRFDYEVSKKIAAEDFPFYALLMATMRQADTLNLSKLKAAFPQTWEEMQARYNAPGGVLAGEEVVLSRVCMLPDCGCWGEAHD